MPTLPKRAVHLSALLVALLVAAALFLCAQEPAGAGGDDSLNDRAPHQPPRTARAERIWPLYMVKTTAPVASRKETSQASVDPLASVVDVQ
jgi:hypothetical protein